MLGDRINLTMGMFRADVLPFLPVEEDAAGNKNGRRLVNDADLQANGWALHTVTLPRGAGQSNSGNRRSQPCRDLSRSDVTVLKKVIIYDGIHIQLANETTYQSLRGFYQSAAAKSAKRHTFSAAAPRITPTSFSSMEPRSDSEPSRSPKPVRRPTGRGSRKRSIVPSPAT